MQIVNFIKDSTIECSPFNWGLTLFSYGCNFHCAMCQGYNYEKVTNKENIIGEAKDIILENITPLHDCVVFLGGEPTIWGNSLKEALQLCHDEGLHTKIFSNGYNCELIEEINNEKLCDAWSIDFKGLHSIQEQFGVPAPDYIKNVSYSIYDIAERSIPLEIRTTFYLGNEQWREEIKSHVRENYLLKYPNIKYIEQEDVRDLI